MAAFKSLPGGFMSLDDGQLLNVLSPYMVILPIKLLAKQGRQLLECISSPTITERYNIKR